VRDPVDGYKSVVIAPHLAGLDWAKGTVPTPHGVIAISIDKRNGISLDLPAGVEDASVLLPRDHQGERLYLDTIPVQDDPALTSHIIHLTHPGHYEITVR